MTLLIAAVGARMTMQGRIEAYAGRQMPRSPIVVGSSKNIGLSALPQS